VLTPVTGSIRSKLGKEEIRPGDFLPPQIPLIGSWFQSLEPSAGVPDMKNSILSCLCATAILLAITAGLSHGQVNSLTENFTTTVYKDAVNTTADWNTGDGELKLFPFTPTLVGNYSPIANANDVAIAGDMAFVAGGLYGLCGGRIRRAPDYRHHESGKPDAFG
jgi:hypothetical protein